jgi:hypothetical protein
MPPSVCCDCVLTASFMWFAFHSVYIKHFAMTLRAVSLFSATAPIHVCVVMEENPNFSTRPEIK